jgi:SWI/SNF related-matrix-associated actin-dependent regulator of chromatin subfamily C
MNNQSFRIEKASINASGGHRGEREKDGVANISEPIDRRDVGGEGVEPDLEIGKLLPKIYSVLDNRKTKPVLVPMHSSWFDPDEIHDIEKRSLPQLLSTDEECVLYKKIRNKIFQAFQDEPHTYLSITACRRSVPEDISVIIKIYTFLEHWGLINYKVGIKREFGTLIKRAGDAGDPRTSRYVAMGESSVQPQISFSVAKSKPDLARDLAKTHSSPGSTPPLTQIPPVIDCTSCGKRMEVLVDGVYLAERERVVLCSDCYEMGKYPATLSYNSFYLLDSGVVRQVWSLEEEMLLLEGIEKYKDDWASVSAYVKTKTIEQCVLHFLKMGIQDPLVEMGAMSFPEMKLPFNYSMNPVMTTVAFLASVVHPGVASEAARAAVREIRRISEEERRGEKEEWLNGRLNEIAAVALSSCVARAEEQKSLELGKKERLLEVLIESELKRAEIKVNEFVQLAQTLKKEREDLEKMRETYRKAHLSARREVAEIICRVKKACEESERPFEGLFF